MKPFIKIALLVCYVFFNAGLSYSMHFCGDDFKLINLYAESKTCCESNEPMPGCCEDIASFELPNTDQQVSDATIFQVLSQMDVTLIHTTLFQHLTDLQLGEASGFADTSPPILKRFPLYLVHQVFLI